VRKFAVLFVLLFSVSAFAQNKDFDIRGHVIGESAADFVGKEPAEKAWLDKRQAEQSNAKSGWYKHQRKQCQTAMAVVTGGARGDLGHNPTWTLDGGNLVRIEMNSYDIPGSTVARQVREGYATPQAVLSELTGKLGDPKAERPTEEISLYSWTLPGGVVILGTTIASRPGLLHKWGEWTLKAETTGEFEKENAANKPKSVLDK
jgi:hypothetical protein